MPCQIFFYLFLEPLVESTFITFQESIGKVYSIPKFKEQRELYPDSTVVNIAQDRAL